MVGTNNDDETNKTKLSAFLSKKYCNSNSSRSNAKNLALLYLFWYVIFGFIHEMIHVITFYGILFILRTVSSEEDSINAAPLDSLFSSFTSNNTIRQNMLNVIFGRCVSMTIPPPKNEEQKQTIDLIFSIVRNSGWVGSLLITFCLWKIGSTSKPKKQRQQDKDEPTHPFLARQIIDFMNMMLLSLTTMSNSSPMVFVSLVTTIEAMATDLFKFEPKGMNNYNLGSEGATNGNADKICMLFFCGNFGIILISNAVFKATTTKDHTFKYSMLDVLEKMIQITMMRGAQSGGVVTFVPSKHMHEIKALKGVRSRVVNKKRTDLSRLVRKKVESDTPPTSVYERYGGKYTKVYFGHTRFATTSKATLDGTHPHIWTEKSERRMFVMHIVRTAGSDPPAQPAQSRQTEEAAANPRPTKSAGRHMATEIDGTADDINDTDIEQPITKDRAALTESSLNNKNNIQQAQYSFQGVNVQNYITHNGDFDIYEVNGRSYDLGTVQAWLPLVLGVPMPSSVDSAAIAGVIDLLRTRGCFALSIRYVVCLDLNTSAMDTQPTIPYPSWKEYERIGLFFEESLIEMLEGKETLKEEGCEEKRDDDTAGDENSEIIRRRRRQRNSAFSKAGEVGKSGKRTLFSISSSDEKRDLLAKIVMSKIEIEFNDAAAKFNEEAAGNERGNKKAKCTGNTPYYSLCKRFIDEEQGASLLTFIKKTIDAFFDNDLLQTTKMFMEHARGSFGLVVMSSLDASKQVCMAARGQPMSVAFYPRHGIVCYGSEQAAVKAGLFAKFNMKEPPPLSTNLSDTKGKGTAVFNEKTRSITYDADPRSNQTLRLDLDDLGGEICLLDWGGGMRPSISRPNKDVVAHKLMNNKVQAVVISQSTTAVDRSVINPLTGRRQRKDIEIYNIMDRMTLIERDNTVVKQLPDETDDPVCTDIQDIPRICKNIQDDWEDVNLNRLTMWNLRKCLKKRLNDISAGLIERNARSVDVLLTGCEVSLWMAEQFATDLQKAFPKLFIKAISSNKILGLFGQEMSIPCTGHPWSQKTLGLRDTIVLIISHSGGTFAPLACSNLLQSYTKNIFVVTSEWDTQIGKQLRLLADKQDILPSCVFTTDVGIRPAEPCTVSVAATHQLLTILFEHICETIVQNAEFQHISGADITGYDLKVLERCNKDNIAALEEIVGKDVDGNDPKKGTATTEDELRKVGDLWAEHVLENTKAYIMTFIYIFATVTIGYTPITVIAIAAGLDNEKWWYLTRFFDAAIYFWLPQINVTILRLIQGRNLRHRMVGRTIVVADCPWVAQSVDAFLSKIFACSYSIAGVNVLHGNPADHLVHRHTHRVVRGSLLACGRPDGRLSALTSLEATTCLSVNQASSIQSHGGTCESITIGHNPYKLPLSHRAVVLKTHRPNFLCEEVLELTNKEDEEDATVDTDGAEEKPSSSDPLSVGALLGKYTDLKHHAKDAATHGGTTVDDILQDLCKEKIGFQRLSAIFDSFASRKGSLSETDCVSALQAWDPSLGTEECRFLFEEADTNRDGVLDFNEFVRVGKMRPSDVIEVLQHARDDRGLIQVEATDEIFFGEELCRGAPKSFSSFELSKSQHFAMELYESRIASLQRFVAFTVMFHQLGKRVENFFSRWSLGLLGYRMDRTHSIMRIATTASPVSGADIQEQMEVLSLTKLILHAVSTISTQWLRHRNATRDQLVQEYKASIASNNHKSSTHKSLIKEGGGDDNGYAYSSNSINPIITSNGNSESINFDKSNNNNERSFSMPPRYDDKNDDASGIRCRFRRDISRKSLSARLLEAKDTSGRDLSNMSLSARLSIKEMPGAG